MDDDELWELIERYDETFGEGPPIFDMADEEACRRMRDAIESGRKMIEAAVRGSPDGGT